MSTKMKTVAALGMAAGLLTLAPLVQADEWNKKTVLTVNEQIEIPGAVLEPGKYVVRLVDSQSNRHIVRFMNEDEDEVISTVLAIPNQRLEPTGETEFGWYETPANEPPALRAWFYPGDTFGQEFVYPEGRGAELATATGMQVPRMAQSDEELLTAQERAPEPAGPSEAEIAQARDREMEQQRQAQAREQERLAAQQQREREQREQAEAAAAAEREREQQQLAQNRAAEERERELQAQRQREQQELEAQRRRTEAAQQQVASANQAPSEELPETAGFTPLLGLLAGLSLGTAAVVRRIRRRS